MRRWGEAYRGGRKSPDETARVVRFVFALRGRETGVELLEGAMSVTDSHPEAHLLERREPESVLERGDLALQIVAPLQERVDDVLTGRSHHHRLLETDLPEAPLLVAHGEEAQKGRHVRRLHE